MKGWIKLHRQFFDHPFWKEDRELSKAEAWIDLWVSAQIEASTVFIKGKGIEVQRGQLIASERFLAKRWSWSRGKIRNFLSYLEKTGMMTTKCTSGETIRHIVKYDVYQESKPKVKPINKTSGRPTKDQIQEEEESNNSLGKPKEKKKSFSPPTIEMLEDYFFEKTENLEFSKNEGSKFFYYYDSKNWIVGKSRMSNWKSAVSGWIKRQIVYEKEKNSEKKEKRTASSAFDELINRQVS